MKNRIKGCTHHDSKVVQKLAAGGRVGSRNSDPAGPRGSSNSSRASGGGLGNSMGSSRANNGSMGSRSSNPAGPRRDSGGLNASSASRPSSSGYNNAKSGGNISNNGLGLRTGSTWSGNTAYGPAGGRATGFARNPAEAKAKMAAAARPKMSSPALKEPGKVMPDARKVPGVTANLVRKPQPKIPVDKTLDGFKPWWHETVELGRKNPYTPISKRFGSLGAGFDERVPQDANRKTKSGEK